MGRDLRRAVETSGFVSWISLSILAVRALSLVNGMWVSFDIG